MRLVHNDGTPACESEVDASGYCIYADGNPVTHWAHRPVTVSRRRAEVAGVCDIHAAGLRTRGDVVYPVDMRMKPGALAQIGDWIFVDSRPRRVTDVRTYLPGTPGATAAPIKPGMVVRAVITGGGTRHFGHLPGSRYQGAEITGLCPDGISFEDAVEGAHP